MEAEAGPASPERTPAGTPATATSESSTSPDLEAYSARRTAGFRARMCNDFAQAVESPPDDPVRMLDLGDGEDEVHPAELPAALPAAVGAVGATAPEPAAIEGMADDQLGGGSPAQQQQKQRQQQRQQGAEAESGEERHRLPLQRGQFGPASPPPLSPFNRQQQSREQQEQAEDEDGEERHPLSPLNRQQQRQERRERACVAPAVDSPPAAAAGGRRQRRVTFAAPPAQQPGQLNSEDSDAAAEPGTSTGTGGALRPADPMQQLVHGMGSLSMRAADRQETRLRHAQLENCALRRQLHLAEEELRRQAWRAGAAAARRQQAVIAESEEDDSGDREPAGFPSRRSLRGGAAPTSSRSSDSRRLLGGSRRRGGYQWEHAECSLEDSSSGEEDEQELWPRSRRGGVQSRGMQDQLRRSSRRAAGSSDWAGASALEAAPSRRSGGRSLRAHTHQQPEGSSGDDAASWAGGQSTASRGQPTASLPSCSTGRRSRQPPAGCTSRGGAAAAGASKGAQQKRTHALGAKPAPGAPLGEVEFTQLPMLLHDGEFWVGHDAPTIGVLASLATCGTAGGDLQMLAGTLAWRASVWKELTGNTGDSCGGIWEAPNQLACGSAAGVVSCLAVGMCGTEDGEGEMLAFVGRPSASTQRKAGMAAVCVRVLWAAEPRAAAADAFALTQFTDPLPAALLWHAAQRGVTACLGEGVWDSMAATGIVRVRMCRWKLFCLTADGSTAVFCRDQFLELHTPSAAAERLLADSKLHDAGKLASKTDRTVASPPAAVVWGPVCVPEGNAAPAVPVWVTTDPAPQGSKARNEKAALAKPARSGRR